jgi:hypothetical protein
MAKSGADAGASKPVNAPTPSMRRAVKPPAGYSTISIIGDGTFF